MGIERVSYKNVSIELDNQVISWLQKFMELTLENLDHPDWFKDILADLNGNFHVAHGKYFFDEAILDNNSERVDYCLKILDITIAQMESINKKQFFEKIQDCIKGT